MFDWIFKSTPLAFFVAPLWRDEAFSYFLAKYPIEKICELTAKDSNPPLYYILLHFWIKYFGNSEIAIRSLSFFCYILSFIAVYRIMREIIKISKLHSIFAVLLYSINPLITYYAFEGRMYSMLVMFAIYSSYFFLKIQNEKKKDLFLIILYCTSTILGLYTHYTMFIVLVIQIMIPITIEIIKKRPTSFIAKKIKYSVISFLFFLPWIFYFYRHQHFSQSFWISELFMKDISYIFSYIYSGISIEYSIISKYKNLSMMIISDFWFFILITISIGVLMYHQKVRSKYAILYFTVLAVVPTYILFFFSLYVKPLFLPRYLIVSSMGISFICIIIFFILIEKYKNYILGSIFLFYFLFVTFYLNIFQIESRKIDNIFAEKVKSIKKDLSSDDKIYVKSELDYMVAQYYFDEKRVFIYDINYDEIPWYVGKVLIPENAIAKEIPYFPEKAILIEQWKNPIVFSKIRN